MFALEYLELYMIRKYYERDSARQKLQNWKIFFQILWKFSRMSGNLPEYPKPLPDCPKTREILCLPCFHSDGQDQPELPGGLHDQEVLRERLRLPGSHRSFPTGQLKMQWSHSYSFPPQDAPQLILQLYILLARHPEDLVHPETALSQVRLAPCNYCSFWGSND